MTENEEIAEQENPVQEEQVVEQPQEPEKKPVEINWERANEVLKLQKQRIEELEAKLTKQVAPPKVEDEKDELDSLDADEYITAAKAKMIRDSAKKQAVKQAEQTTRQVLQEYAQQQKIASDEQRMRGKHEDFDYIIENFAIPMIKNDPALAYQIQMSKNPAETAYKLAKISDEYEGSTMKQQSSQKAEKILKNSSRPVSSNAVGSPLKNQAEDFSKLTSNQIWEMSQKYAKGA